jgi:prephenate dehydratase
MAAEQSIRRSRLAVHIAFLGPAGTFTEVAARKYAAANYSAYHMAPFTTVGDVLLAVDDRQVDCGVVPVENSSEGTVVLTLDYLVHEVDVRIIGEVVVPIRHHLLGWDQAALESITDVVSHPQALAQCRRHLQQLLPHARLHMSHSTAAAVQQVKESRNARMAALGTQLAREIYGLRILQADMQDSDKNATRFLVVAKQPVPASGDDKTSIVFGFKVDRPGNLYRALREFAIRNINLTKLESRPARRELGDYLFFADLDGHVNEAPVQAALAELQKECSLVRVLGSYPQARSLNQNLE